jgi:rhodanese-related sulfurtransferase
MDIGPQTTMAEILAAYPAAKLGLFRRYHIGGCTACGYQPEDTIEQVRRQYNIEDSIDAMAQVIQESSKAEAQLLVLPTVIAAKPAERMIDVRAPEEFEKGHIPGAQLLTFDLTFEILDTWPKETPIVCYSSTGRRGLEKASYFAAYGFTSVRNLAGGLEAWTGAIERSPAPAEATP